MLVVQKFSQFLKYFSTFPPYCQLVFYTWEDGFRSHFAAIHLHEKASLKAPCRHLRIGSGSASSINRVHLRAAVRVRQQVRSICMCCAGMILGMASPFRENIGIIAWSFHGLIMGICSDTG